MGGGLFIYEHMPEVRRALRNVLYDTAAIPFLYEPSILSAAVASGIGEKLLYGSDYPILSYSRYKKMFEKIADFSEFGEKIMSLNALRLRG